MTFLDSTTSTPEELAYCDATRAFREVYARLSVARAAYDADSRNHVKEAACFEMRAELEAAHLLADAAGSVLRTKAERSMKPAHKPTLPADVEVFRHDCDDPSEWDGEYCPMAHCEKCAGEFGCSRGWYWRLRLEPGSYVGPFTTEQVAVNDSVSDAENLRSDMSSRHLPANSKST